MSSVKRLEKFRKLRSEEKKAEDRAKNAELMRQRRKAAKEMAKATKDLTQLDPKSKECNSMVGTKSVSHVQGLLPKIISLQRENPTETDGHVKRQYNNVVAYFSLEEIRQLRQVYDTKQDRQISFEQWMVATYCGNNDNSVTFDKPSESSESVADNLDEVMGYDEEDEIYDRTASTLTDSEKKKLEDEYDRLHNLGGSSQHKNAPTFKQFVVERFRNSTDYENNYSVTPISGNLGNFDPDQAEISNGTNLNDPSLSAKRRSNEIRSTTCSKKSRRAIHYSPINYSMRLLPRNNKEINNNK